MRLTCTRCNGLGHLPQWTGPCLRCRGIGTVPERKPTIHQWAAFRDGMRFLTIVAATKTEAEQIARRHAPEARVIRRDKLPDPDISVFSLISGVKNNAYRTCAQTAPKKI